MKGNKRDIKKFFEGYFAKECPSHGKFYSWVLDLLQVEGGGKLLDIGCGNGRLLKVAETRGSSTYGIDISNKVAEASKEVAVSAEICVGDAESLPWKDNCFDYLVDIGTLQFLSDQAQGINEITPVLKKGGRVCMIAGNLFSWYRFL